MASSLLGKGIPDETKLNKLKDLGLGSGLDMTYPKPWRKRGSYVVCRLNKLDEVVVFDEGGNWHIHEHVVSSRTDMQSQVNLGIAVPDTPIKIWADAEYSRSNTFARKTFGRRLIDCKASIRPERIEAVGHEAHDTFEERLSEWLVTKFKYYSDAAKVVESDLGIDKVEEITCNCVNQRFVSLSLEEAEKHLVVDAYKHSCSCSQEEEAKVETLQWDLLVALCLRFIKRFRVTHFVHTFELGVMEYRVEEETNLTTRKGGGVGVSAAAVGSAGASAKINWEEFSSHKQTMKIGIYDEKTKQVTRPAVVSVDVYPITNLVRRPHLRLALQTALNKYVAERQTEEGTKYRCGPFVISFGPDKESFFLTVSEDQKILEASNKRKDAAPLFLVKGGSTFEDEFYLVYYGKNLIEMRGGLFAPSTATSIPYYLEANPGFLGGHYGPLYFKPNTASEAAEYKFRIESQMNEHNSLKQILEGHKLFYIRCPRKWKFASYLYLEKSQPSSNGSKFQSGCVHSKTSHDQMHGFMLFRLEQFKPGECSPYSPDQSATAPDPSGTIPDQERPSEETVTDMS